MNLIITKYLVIIISCLIVKVENVDILMHKAYVGVGGSYIAGIKSSDFIICTYNASNDISGQFTVRLKQHSEIPKPTKQDQITELGDYGFCAVLVQNVSRSTPRYWAIEEKHENNLIVKGQYEIIVTDALQAVPITKRITVAEEGTYKIGYLPLRSMKKCICRSDTGVNFEFELTYVFGEDSIENNRIPSAGTNNSVYHHGTKNRCMITVSKVTIDGPKSWTITASDGNQNLATNTFTIQYFNRRDLLLTPTNSVVYMTDRDTIEIGYEYHEGINLCQLESFKHGTITFSVQETQSHTDADEQPFDLFEISASSLGNNGQCKIKLQSTSKFEDFDVTIKASSVNYDIDSFTYSIKYVGEEDLITTATTVHVIKGDQYTIGFEYHEAIKYCRVSQARTKNAIMLEMGREDINKGISLTNNGYNVVSAQDQSKCLLSIKNAKFIGRKTLYISVLNSVGTPITTVAFRINVHSKDYYQTTPCSGYVYLTPMDEFDIGFLYYYGITGCYYESSNYNGYFEVDPEGVQLIVPLDPGTITTLGENSKCQLRIRDGLALPKSFKITAAANHHNISSETFHIITYNKIQVAHNKIEVYEMQDIIQSLIGENREFSKCVLKSEQLHIEFNPATKEVFGVYDIKETVNRVSVLKEYPCGFKITNFNEEDCRGNSEWLLVGTDQNHVQYGAKFSINCRESETIETNYELEVSLGSTTTIPCEAENGNLCELRDPNQNLIKYGNPCNYDIKSVFPEDIGKWTCTFGRMGAFMPFTYTYRLIIPDDSLRVTSKSFTCGIRLCISCQFTDTIPTDMCKMVSPSKKSYMLYPGSSTERYSSVYTNLSQGICAMEIEEPLQDFEIGLWMCELRRDARIYGTTFQIGSEENTIPEYKHEFALTIGIQEELFIDCEVPYSATNCYITSPSGKAFFDKPQFQPQFGRCAMKVNQYDRTRNGTWNCYFSQGGVEIDDVIKIHVTQTDFSAEQPIVEAKEGSKAKFTCSSSGKPLSYCIFISPQNTSFHIGSTKEIKNLTSYGQELDQGKCCIEIDRINSSDYGTWKCVSQIVGHSSALYATIQLQDPPCTGSSKSLSLTTANNDHIQTGVIVIITLLGIIVFAGIAIVLYRNIIVRKY